MNKRKKHFVLLLCLFLPFAQLCLDIKLGYSEETILPLEFEMPAVVDGLRAFNVSITINDFNLRSYANHFEVEYPDALLNITGWNKWTSYPHSTEGLGLTRINYYGQEKLDLTMKKHYPGTNDVPEGGKLSWIMFSLFRIDFLGKQAQFDSDPTKTYNVPEELIVFRYENNMYNYYKRQFLASANSTYNVAPLLFTIDLPAGWKGTQAPLDYDEARWSYESSSPYEYYDFYVWEPSILRYTGQSNWNKNDDKNYDDLWYWTINAGGLNGVPKPLNNELIERFTASKGEYTTQISITYNYSINQDICDVRLAAAIWSTKYNYTLSFKTYHAFYVEKDKGSIESQKALDEMIAVLGSLRLEHDLTNVKPVTITYTGGGSGINLAIIPISLADAPITHNKAYFEEIAAKVATYYKEVSYETLTINIEVIDIDGAWATIPKNKANYNANSKVEFINDAINAIDENLDFTSYDYDPINGIGVVAFYTEPNLFNDGAFAYSNRFSAAFDTDDGVKVDAIYQFKQRLEPQAGVTKMARSLCHEFGHVLGKLLVTSLEGSAKDTWWLLPDEYLIGNVKCFQSLMGNLDSLLIERVHPSSYIKEWLGWLSYSEAPVNTTLVIPALDKMSYGDSVYTMSLSAPNSLASYYIIEYRNALTSSKWDNQFSHDAALGIKQEVIIYRVNVPSSGSLYSSLNRVFAMFEWNGVLNVTKNTFSDPVNKVEFKPVQLGADAATVTYTDYNPVNLVGGVINLVAVPALPEVAYDDREFTLPDTDLHAYTSDGRHVGVNYVTGEYENQIAGAIVSGDLTGDSEWIFVPNDVTVSFHVSSRDTAAYLRELPEAKQVTNGDQSYTLQIFNYDSTGKIITSQSNTQTVESGKAVEYTYNINGNTISLTSKPSTIQDIFDATATLGNIKITVKDYSGNPINGVSISSSVQPSGQTVINGVTNSEGTITFNNILLGNYTFLASKTGYLNGTVQCIISSSDLLEVNASLQTQPSNGGGIPGYPPLAIALALISVIFILRKNHSHSFISNNTPYQK